MHRLIERFKNQRIAVWGDLILDEYIFTRAARVSREAPVLITEYECDEFRLGGGGNVAANIRALGGHPVPVAFIGTDPGGRILQGILEQSGIDASGLLPLEDFVTPRKTRILSGGSHTRRQQVLRIDRLNRSPVSDHQRGLLLRRLGKALAGCDFLVVSDYLHCSVRGEDLSLLAAEMELPPVAVDSRRHLRHFSHMHVATPNLPELGRLFPDRELKNDDSLIRAGRELLESLDARGILLKRGDQGMVLVEAEGPARPIGIYGSREIVDVTGAGDTVIALLSLALSAGSDLFTAARAASVAAGITVMKAGAATVSPGELSSALAEDGRL